MRKPLMASPVSILLVMILMGGSESGRTSFLKDKNFLFNPLPNSFS
jgi:hypothetical protein